MLFDEGVALFRFDKAAMSLHVLSPSVPRRPRLIFKLLALIVLFSGLSSAAFIRLAQDRIDRQSGATADSNELLSPENSRRYTHDVELYYGKTGLVMEKCKRWLESMTHGRPLAILIAVASLILDAGLFRMTASSRNQVWLPEPSTPSRSPEQ
jgi:hypothetical protein